MDVINVGLGAVLYDIETGTYYTPNTGQVTGGDEEEKLIKSKRRGQMMNYKYLKNLTKIVQILRIWRYR